MRISFFGTEPAKEFQQPTSRNLHPKGTPMNEINSHCTYCGTPFPRDAPWPRRCRTCSHTSYLNPLPVVVVMVPVGEGILVVRRNIEPSRGTLTLPGGYLDIGETWQQGAVRELLEESGIAISPEAISLYHVDNGLDDTLVIIGLAEVQPPSIMKPFTSTETQEISLIFEPTELGFPLHTLVVLNYFTARGMMPPTQP
jgi:ADP-ribose pyrophosphatase YjhB (NUDIX family)